MKTLLHVSALFMLLAASWASAQSPPSSPDIYLLAGTGTQSYSGDSGPAIDAGLDFPTGEAIDAVGNLYFDDEYNHRIRRIDAVTGIITTVAGNGTEGYSGDNGPAVNAELNYPTGLSMDAAGNLYIADTINARIRRVDAATGIITTMAGNGNLVFSGAGPAISAAVGNPARTALDSAGNLYFTDISDGRILKVEAATGIITSVAGNGTESYSGDGGPAISAGLYGPNGLALDSAGNIYAADTGNNRVRKVTAATGIITTVAGIGASSENGAAGIGSFSGDGGPATSAGLYWPYDVALDAAGDLFISDVVNERIRRVDASTGIITTVAGDGTPGIGGFGAPATDAPLENPSGVLVDSKGAIYIGDSGASMVLIVGPETQYSGVIPTTTALSSSLNTLGLGQSVTLTAKVTAASGATPDGTVIFLNGTIWLGAGTLNSSGIATLTLTPPVGNYSITASYSGSSVDAPSVSAPPVAVTVTAIPTITITASAYTVPVGQPDLVTITVTPVVAGPEASVQIQITGQATQTMTLVNGQAVLYFTSTLAGTYRLTAALITSPNYTGPSASIVITVTNSPNIYLFAGSGSEGTGGDGCLASAAQLDPVYSIASNAAGDVYIADFLSNQIRRVDDATGIITTVAGTGVQGFSGDGGPATSAEFNNPYGVALDAAGDIYVADTHNFRIRRINAATGVITTIAGDGTEGYSGDGGPAASAEINSVYGIGSDAAGNLYIGDNGTNRVRKVDVVTGVITTVAGDGGGGFSGDGGPATSAELADPLGSALDAAGNLYIADSANNKIRMVAAGTGIITTVAGNGTPGYSGDGGPAIDAELSNGILGVASDAAGNLYIPDIYNNRIRRVDAATGIITTVAGDGVAGGIGIGGPAIDAEIFQPTTVTLDAAGNIYLESFDYGQILIVGAQPSYPLIATTTTLTTVPTNLTAGQTLTLTANVSAATCATPTGTVTFLNGTTSLGTATLNSGGVATLTLTPPVGVYSITASYGGSSTDAPSVSSPPVSVTVSNSSIATTTSITTSAAQVAYGLPFTVTVTVNAASESAPTGSVTLFQNGQPLPNLTLSNGSDSVRATFNLPARTYSFYATYAGNGADEGSTSGTIIVVVVPNGPVNSPNIYLFAGNGTSGNTGDGCLASAAELDPVYSIASDAAGDIYIADWRSNSIRKVSASNGIITTVAGNGTAGYSGDNGPATSAELNNPEAVTIDAAGNIYIADMLNYRIRKVDAATGIITTIAGNGTSGFGGDGGPATSAEISVVYGVAADAAGNIYLSDVGNNRVRRVDAVTGIITTFAGNGTSGYSGDGGPATNAEFDVAYQVEPDAFGNVYILDSGNFRVRKVAASTGIVTTFAGNGTSGYSGDGRPATSAEINGSDGIALDAAADLFIADSFNNRIRRVDAATGIIATVAGDGVEGNSGLGGPAIDAELAQPTSVALDAAGNIYIENILYTQILIVGAQPSYPLIATTTTLTAVPTMLTVGQTLTLTANVSASTCATPTGTVTFLNGTASLGTATLNSSGVATLALTPPVGTYSITASYGGSSLDAPSVSAPPAQVTVNPAPAATTALLTASPNPAAFGANVTFTVAVSGAAGTPTGSVSFFDGTAPLGTATLASGTATYSTSSLSVGQHTITAQYAGDAQFAACISNAVVETISQADFSIAVAPASQSVYTGESAPFTVTITPGAGFNLPAALSCSLLPAATTCSFSPANLNAAGSSTLTVQTTAPGQPASAFVFASGAGATALAGLILLFVPARRKVWFRFFALVLLLLAGMTALGGCGGSRSLLGGTPLGPQTIAVNAVATNGSQTLAHQATLTLNVKSLF